MQYNIKINIILEVSIIKKFLIKTYKFINKGGVEVLICGIIAIIIILFVKNNHNRLFDILDFTIIFSIIGTVFIGVITMGLKKILLSNIEDYLKLNSNYTELINIYSGSKSNMITYTINSNLYDNREYKIGLKKLKCKEVNGEIKFVFPVILIKLCTEEIEYEVKDSKNKYELPDWIKEHYDEIFAAHEGSDTYNQLNIRLDKVKITNNNTIEFCTSRTTYYSSLVTNRAMDFRLKNSLTVRDMFAYGPFVPQLEQSDLSNHLGFNGFIESSDGEIALVKRGKNVSIGKNTIANSIGASLKSKYAINEYDGEVTIEGIEKAIKMEIKDELGIKYEKIEFSLKKNIIAIYRDLVEGGKPQLLFYIHMKKCTKDDINDAFEEKKNKKKEAKNVIEKNKIDGNKIICIKRKDLKQMFISRTLVVIEGKKYDIMPSASAALVMLLEYMDKKEECN